MFHIGYDNIITLASASSSETPVLVKQWLEPRVAEMQLTFSLEFREDAILVNLIR